MISFNPIQLEEWTGGRWTTLPAASLSGFTIDTRQLREGQVFVALKTAQRDGHDFLEVAREAGASAAIVSTQQTEVDLPQLVVPDPLVAFQAIARQHRQSFVGARDRDFRQCGQDINQGSPRRFARWRRSRCVSYAG